MWLFEVVVELRSGNKVELLAVVDVGWSEGGRLIQSDWGVRCVIRFRLSPWRTEIKEPLVGVGGCWDLGLDAVGGCV